MVFNLHGQFETLRADGRYERLRDAILERDLATSGASTRCLPSMDIVVRPPV
jgi:FPC/CPF motif-containing protein YcgG